MIRRGLLILLVLVILFSISIPAFAHDKTGHDAILERVLFGEPSFLSGLTPGSKPYKALDALEDAVAICLDQYQGNYEDLLAELRAYKVHGLPESIKEIDFSGNQYHRRYTHFGWNNVYTPTDLAHWEIRKTILGQTVDHVFGFQKKAGVWTFLGRSKDYGYTAKCDAFAAFLYYLHVLGDYTASDKKTVHGSVIPLARLHPEEGNEDIFFEIERVLPLVLEQAAADNDIAYCGLMQDIKTLHKLCISYEESGGVTDESFPDYQALAKKLLEKLEGKVPGLLKNEPYFKDVFY